MTKKSIFIGDKEAQFTAPKVEGKLIDFDEEKYYKIANFDAMRPFFMSIVSDSNHWVFLSSNGGLTAGRKDSSLALFPYYTDDKITESADITGSKTILQVHSDTRMQLWEPFSDRYLGMYSLRRNLYKNSFGNKVIFEEVNQDLGLTFSYQWSTSDRFGFVKKATLMNNSEHERQVEVLDGIQNILPFGIDPALQAIRSNLADAYKKNELEAELGMGIYALSAIIVDRAEPSEALKAATVWSTGFENPKYLVSSLQLNAFRQGKDIVQEEGVRAEKGAYFVVANTTLKAGSEKEWMLVADVNQSISSIKEIAQQIKNRAALETELNDDIEKGTQHLLELTSAADGLQITADKLQNTRHFANVLFNIMRGGIFDDNYQIEKGDFTNYIEKANNQVFKNKKNVLEQLPSTFSLAHLKKSIQILDNNDENGNYKRLCFEYLPLKFSRRHGDPSRPWNKFSINTKNDDGTKILDYQGNWRDIFQNWEALAHSYPEFMENMIHKFLNATTFDGYNPYRITKDGFDWETIEPDDPWSYIGYWGDHQIIYLLKFLEFIEKHKPNSLAQYFDQDIFVYANVPYAIKSYSEILKNPKDTIILDSASENSINQERNELGADGTLLKDAGSRIYKVNIVEKLLATVLSKMSNFIPEGGIWMNTQRPEWNDANNALVGNGVSMVTLYYLRRFLNFFEDVVAKSEYENVQVSEELGQFFDRVLRVLSDYYQVLTGKISDSDRKSVLDGLGTAGSDYRNAIYDSGFSGHKIAISKKEVLRFLAIAKLYLDHSIVANKREDKLFHAYNLMTVKGDSEISIAHLPEMLEGQVAVLSSGYLSAETSLELLNALKASDLFRADQYSYVLYPNKQLARFVDKNTIPTPEAKKSRLVQQLVADGNTSIVEKDVHGEYHFNGNLNNINSLIDGLAQLPKEHYGSLIEEDFDHLSKVFEDLFDHKSYTGRSGTFFGYEGLGSIYWHMVSKLLLSVQETCLEAMASKENEAIIGALLDHYYEINEGIGVHKSPDLYGAFPTDPYSHTPSGKGAQQPGMTGQVKEDILCRFGELGVFVSEGCLVFNPQLLRKEEFLKKPASFTYCDTNNKRQKLQLPPGSLAFTYCQIPIVYVLGQKTGLTIETKAGSTETDRLALDAATSRKLFWRTGEIDKITVYINK